MATSFLLSTQLFLVSMLLRCFIALYLVCCLLHYQATDACLSHSAFSMAMILIFCFTYTAIDPFTYGAGILSVIFLAY